MAGACRRTKARQGKALLGYFICEMIFSFLKYGSVLNMNECGWMDLDLPVAS